jgi:hypothetical protein
MIRTENLIAIVRLDPDHEFGMVKPRHPWRIGEYGRSILRPRGVTGRGQAHIGGADFVKKETSSAGFARQNPDCEKRDKPERYEPGSVTPQRH